jgi:SP family facilitated glucose transporter-like MFS transporter 8
MLKGRNEMATVTLITLRGDPEVANKEASRIKSNLEKQKQSNSSDNQSSYVKSQLKTITKGTFVRPCMVVSILMVVFWQWSGGALITFYTEDILEQFGVPIPVPWIATGVGCYMFICSFLGAFISSVIPRRKYYMGSGVLVSLGAAILGATVHLSKYDFFVDLLNKNEEVKWLPVMGLLLYLLGYQLGYISVCFMLLGELLPSNARGIGGCIIIFFNNISFFVAVKSSNICQEILGLDGLFGLFSIVAFFSTIFAYFFVPETFGKSLEEMEEHYREICYTNQYQKYKSKTENINMAYISGQE